MFLRISMFVLAIGVSFSATALNDKCVSLLQQKKLENTRPVEDSNFAELKYRLKQNIDLMTPPGTHSAVMRISNRIVRFSPKYKAYGDELLKSEVVRMTLGSLPETSEIFLSYLEGLEYRGWFIDIHNLNSGILSAYNRAPSDILRKAVFKNRHATTGRYIDSSVISLLSTLEVGRIDLNLYDPEVLDYMMDQFIEQIELGNHKFDIDAESILNKYSKHQKPIVDGRQSYDLIALMREISQVLYEIYPQFFSNGPVELKTF